MPRRSVNYSCSVCSFSLWHPIARLSVSTLGLYNDSRFPGRCILILDKHEEDFSELNADLATSFIKDAQIASRAIRKVTNSNRINYAILGNRVPHIHFHLIPRGTPNDPDFTRSPWDTSVEKTEMADEATRNLIEDISAALDKTVSASADPFLRTIVL